MKERRFVDHIFDRVVKSSTQICVGTALLLVTMISCATAQEGISDDRVLFGQSAAFDGPASSLGTDYRDGLLAAFNEANLAGGIDGRRLELISYNDGYEPDQAIENTNRLIKNDHVFALVGQVGTPTAQSAQPIAKKIMFRLLAHSLVPGFYAIRHCAMWSISELPMIRKQKR